MALIFPIKNIGLMSKLSFFGFPKCSLKPKYVRILNWKKENSQQIIEQIQNKAFKQFKIFHFSSFSRFEC